jgi:hypothetical protein
LKPVVTSKEDQPEHATLRVLPLSERLVPEELACDQHQEQRPLLPEATTALHPALESRAFDPSYYQPMREHPEALRLVPSAYAHQTSDELPLHEDRATKDQP